MHAEVKNSYKELLNHGQTIADMVSKNSEYGIYTENQESLLNLVGSLAVDTNVAYVSIFNQDRRQLVHKIFKPSVQIPSSLLNKNVGLTSQVLHEEFINKEDGKRYVDILVPVVSVAKNDPIEIFPTVQGTPQRKTVGYVQIGLTQEGFHKRINQFFISALLFTFWIALLGVLITLLITRKITSPLKRLKLATQDISEGKFDHQIKMETSDEISDLTRSFNHMLENLSNYRTQIEDRNAELTAANQQMRQEIAERKRAEEAMRKAEARYRSLFERIPLGLYRTAPSGQILDVNPALVKMLGYPDRESLLATNAGNTYANPPDRIQWKALVEHEGGVRNYEKQLCRHDRTIIWVEENTQTVRDAKGQVLFYEGSFKDITERKQVEKEKAVLEEQFRQSQKMEAIGQLAGGIAHDFNNLLTVIKGYSQLSIPDLKENDPLRENIVEIESAADRAANLTRQILAFSRRQVMEMKVLDVNTLLRDLDKMLRRVIGEDIELVTLFASDLGRVKTDPGQIEQVVMNLAVNARDAMPNGGKLTIETANVELDEAYALSHISVVPGRYVMLSVSDAGVGMTPEVRDHIFEPFFTTKDRGKGTGLGLSTVYGIVKQSDGNIWVYSEPGHGTTFKIYLPRVDEPLEEARERVVKDGLPLGRETILLVEDEKEVRRLTTKILEKQGYS
jgi:PAS domain S-box-containing protein